MEMDVELGRGYILADSKENPTIGTIPQDAIFSPVEKVNYTTEPVHVGQETSYERLNLYVWTDGTISPSEAVSESAAILLKQFQPFTSIGGAPVVIHEKRVEKLAIPEEKFNMPIEQLDLSVRSLNCLRHAGLTTVGEVLTRGIDELMGLRNFGLKSLNELEERLQVFGLSLNQPGESCPPEEVAAPVEEEEEKKPKRKRSAAAE
jgi:DNA-directed RNA polymerase subunit alpha